mmetsp:Transcript_101542/g.284720  ORF Transcript_101542/g.284720 Transcript_101542/m.284720 type:complete len:218 (+) Transcript_101542:368-1021(+)
MPRRWSSSWCARGRSKRRPCLLRGVAPSLGVGPCSRRPLRSWPSAVRSPAGRLWRSEARGVAAARRRCALRPWPGGLARWSRRAHLQTRFESRGAKTPRPPLVAWSGCRRTSAQSRPRRRWPGRLQRSQRRSATRRGGLWREWKRLEARSSPPGSRSSVRPQHPLKPVLASWPPSSRPSTERPSGSSQRRRPCACWSRISTGATGSAKICACAAVSS